MYARPHDPHYPQVCLDEASKQILSEVRTSIPMQCGQPQRVDNEYRREGTCSLFMLFEPLAGKRRVLVRDRRTGLDYAQVIRLLCDRMYPDAQKIVLVQDNLNTHGPHSLYAAFAPTEARRLMERIEWHYTPRHGSWLHTCNRAQHGRNGVVGSGNAVFGGADGKPRVFGDAGGCVGI